MSERQAYTQAADYFLAALAKVRLDQWDAPGLGEWTVRELAAHTARAMLTVEQFTHQPAQRPDIPSAAAYYRRAFVGQGTNERIAERGRTTAVELGLDLVATVTALRDRVTRMIAALPDDHLCGTLIGGIRLVDYLPTRTLELVVHTLDLQEATGIEGTPPPEALRETLHLLVDLALDTPHAGRFALLATGRDSWRGPFTVLG